MDLLPDEEYDELSNITRDPSHYEIPWKSLKVSNIFLGQGKFGKVQEGSVSFGQKRVRVAVKSIHGKKNPLHLFI